MGKSARPKPKQLARKLLQIRNSLGLSQDQMLKQLRLSKGLFRSAVSGYELGTREPPLPVLLTYAQLAGVWVDALIDDDLDLPERLPARQRKKR
jgi:transcriptional regulator with XRE-family HTH domain